MRRLLSVFVKDMRGDFALPLPEVVVGLMHLSSMAVRCI